MSWLDWRDSKWIDDNKIIFIFSVSSASHSRSRHRMNSTGNTADETVSRCVTVGDAVAAAADSSVTDDIPNDMNVADADSQELFSELSCQPR